jgi:hypothetical protein
MSIYDFYLLELLSYHKNIRSSEILALLERLLDILKLQGQSHLIIY